MLMRRGKSGAIWWMFLPPDTSASLCTKAYSVVQPTPPPVLQIKEIYKFRKNKKRFKGSVQQKLRWVKNSAQPQGTGQGLWRWTFIFKIYRTIVRLHIVVNISVSVEYSKIRTPFLEQGQSAANSFPRCEFTPLHLRMCAECHAVTLKWLQIIYGANTIGTVSLVPLHLKSQNSRLGCSDRKRKCR